VRAGAAPGLSPGRHVLGNGAVVLAQRTLMSPAVTISASFEAGSVYDPPSLPGAVQLLVRLLDRGTLRRSADDIAEELDSRGVALEVHASRHDVTVSATCLREDFDDVLDLVVDVSRHPVFPEEELSKRRAERQTEILQDADNPYIRAAEAVSEMLYGHGHPYGRPARGTLDTLERIQRADLVELHRRTMLPSTACVAIVGDVAPERAIEAAVRVLGDWEGPRVERATVPPPPHGVRSWRAVDMPGKPQSDIAYGFTSISRLDPRHDAYWIMNNVLGEFGIGGRLAANLRERQGMAYYAFSSFEPMGGAGPLFIRAGVEPSSVERAVDAIDAEVHALGSSGPTLKEFEESREYLIGSVPRLLETSRSIAQLLQLEERFGLGTDYDRRLPALLRAVSLDQVRAAAAEALRPDRACIAVAGPDLAVRAA
jgi:zinc protease